MSPLPFFQLDSDEKVDGDFLVGGAFLRVAAAEPEKRNREEGGVGKAQFLRQPAVLAADPLVRDHADTLGLAPIFPLIPPLETGHSP
jgi:hypothetical protein